MRRYAPLIKPIERNCSVTIPLDDTTGRDTDALLVHLGACRSLGRELLSPLSATLASTLPDWTIGRLAHHAQQAWAFIYVHAPARMSLTAEQILHWQAAIVSAIPAASAGLSVKLSRLQRQLEFAGASSEQTPCAHYVVETDAEAGWMPEIARWYEVEHLPGLASAPGCVRAFRYLNHDHGPESLACYDLTTEEALSSPAWLAVRATEWSSRTRPHFVSTRRTMFRVIDPSPAAVG